MDDRYFRFIVIKNGEYLVGVPYKNCVRWSASRYDAARFYKREFALKVANRVGGRVEIINTITGVIV